MRKNPVRTKLRSQEGASILFALFFFIVCSVIGSIVLTAATAAAGRMKDVEQNNKNYYAVNSAANLLESVVNDPSQTKVTLKKERYVTETYEKGVNTTDPNNWPDSKTWDKDEMFKGIEGSQLAKALYGCYKDDVNKTTPPDQIKTKLKLNHGDGDDDPLNVLVEITGATSGYERKIQISSIEIVKKDEKEEEKHDYSLILTCTPHVEIREDSKVTLTTVDGGRNTMTRQIHQTKTKTVTWSVTSVSKGGAVKNE